MSNLRNNSFQAVYMEEKDLQTIAEEKMNEKLDRTNAFELLQFAKDNKISKLAKDVLKFIAR